MQGQPTKTCQFGTFLPSGAAVPGVLQGANAFRFAAVQLKRSRNRSRGHFAQFSPDRGLLIADQVAVSGRNRRPRPSARQFPDLPASEPVTPVFFRRIAAFETGQGRIFATPPGRRRQNAKSPKFQRLRAAQHTIFSCNCGPARRRRRFFRATPGRSRVGSDGFWKIRPALQKVGGFFAKESADFAATRSKLKKGGPTAIRRVLLSEIRLAGSQKVGTPRKTRLSRQMGRQSAPLGRCPAAQSGSQEPKENGWLRTRIRNRSPGS